MKIIKDNEHLEELNKLIIQSQKIILCSGWIFLNGLKLLNKSLLQAIENKSEILIYSSQEHTKTNVIKKLKKINIPHKILKKELGKVHTKLYYFEDTETFTAIIGSANISDGGLLNNSELSIKITDKVGSNEYKELQEYILSLDALSQHPNKNEETNNLP